MASWLELEVAIRRRNQNDAAICSIDVERVNDEDKSELTVRSLSLFSNAPLDFPASAYDDWIISTLGEVLAVLKGRREAQKQVYGPAPAPLT